MHVLRLFGCLVADRPLRVAVRRHYDVRQANRVGARLDPARAMASVARRALAAEADQIDLNVPLATAQANRAHSIEAAVARLQRNDVEGVWAVGAGAIDDVAGVGHALLSLWPSLTPVAPGGSCIGPVRWGGETWESWEA